MSQAKQLSKPGFGIQLQPWQTVLVTARYRGLAFAHLLMSAMPSRTVRSHDANIENDGTGTQPRQPPKARGDFCGEGRSTCGDP